jgi:hypothetical protein
MTYSKDWSTIHWMLSKSIVILERQTNQFWSMISIEVGRKQRETYETSRKRNVIIHRYRSYRYILTCLVSIVIIIVEEITSDDFYRLFDRETGQTAYRLHQHIVKQKHLMDVVDVNFDIIIDAITREQFLIVKKLPDSFDCEGQSNRTSHWLSDDRMCTQNSRTFLVDRDYFEIKHIGQVRLVWFVTHIELSTNSSNMITIRKLNITRIHYLVRTKRIQSMFL